MLAENSAVLANAKHPIFHTPPGVINMLLGVNPQCTVFASVWRKFNPSAICSMPCLISNSDRGTTASERGLPVSSPIFAALIKSPAVAMMLSVTMTNWVRVSSKGSMRRRTQGCLRRARKAASWRHRSRKASLEAVSPWRYFFSKTHTLTSLNGAPGGGGWGVCVVCVGCWVVLLHCFHSHGLCMGMMCM